MTPIQCPMATIHNNINNRQEVTALAQGLTTPEGTCQITVPYSLVQKCNRPMVVTTLLFPSKISTGVVQLHQVCKKELPLLQGEVKQLICQQLIRENKAPLPPAFKSNS